MQQQSENVSLGLIDSTERCNTANPSKQLPNRFLVFEYTDLLQIIPKDQKVKIVALMTKYGRLFTAATQGPNIFVQTRGKNGLNYHCLTVYYKCIVTKQKLRNKLRKTYVQTLLIIRKKYIQGQCLHLTTLSQQIVGQERLFYNASVHRQLQHNCISP